MSNDNFYELVIIGGGISSCVFVSSFLKNGFKGRIAIVEAGRKLGGRASTRSSFNNKGWELNHGSPNFNIVNKSKNLLLENFINQLLEANIIKLDVSESIEINDYQKFITEENLDFYSGSNYIPRENMTQMAQDIIYLNDNRNQVDFYFEEFIINLNYVKNKWILTSNKFRKYHASFIVISSNLLLHERSLDILSTDEIPLRKAIPLNCNKDIDLIINIVSKQEYIQRLTFLIYTKSNYFYRDKYSEKYRYFILNNLLEQKYKIERVIFQKQKNNKLGIVIHTKNNELINKFLELGDTCLFKENLLSSFNKLFESNSTINQLEDYQNISIMRWRASQPSGIMVPNYLQVFEKQKLGFCGDWFDFEGFGRIEGAITSALSLSSKVSHFL